MEESASRSGVSRVVGVLLRVVLRALNICGIFTVAAIVTVLIGFTLQFVGLPQVNAFTAGAIVGLPAALPLWERIRSLIGF